MATKDTNAETAQAAAAESPLKVHDLRPAPGAKKAKTRVGRGEASKGKTAGRGTKGTKARYQVPERFEGGQTPLHMRLPKLRGFKNPFKVTYQVVNVDQIATHFPEGGEVNAETLVEAGLVRRNQPVKVLGSGEISVAVNVTADKFSASAEQKISAAGGSTTTL
ncbi:50S ribosomal protein L15 [Kytococcus sedentarius]|uniref:50S ribosomal protein L15 n=1 Tax=Kytococcus sedentarius TaxID=1276 RepID=UPI0035BBCACD